MPSTYTLNNGIELIATGEQSGTWGDTTNTNLSLVDTALDGQVTVTLPSAGTSGSPNTLAISDGAASDGRNRMVIFNDGGDLGATAYVQLTPNDAEKIIYVRNDLAGSRSIILFQGTYNASNDYELPAGTTAVIYFDGAGSGAVAANVFNNAYFDSLRLGSVSVTAIIDDDTMATAAATNIATSESIKAYVDAQVGANNELSEVLANGNTTGGTDIAVSSGDDITFADSSKAIFGAGSDLQIYHDGSNSRILENGTGFLAIGTNGGEISLRGDSFNDYMLKAEQNSAVTLYHNALPKLATESGGVNITGTLTSDGLTVDGTGTAVTLQSNNSGGPLNILQFKDTDTSLANTQSTGNIEWYTSDADSAGVHAYIKTLGYTNSPADLIFGTGLGGSATIRMKIGYQGDITFYDTSGNASFVYDESAGSTFNENGDNKDFRVESDSNANMLFVDAGNDRVGVGESSPASTLDVNGNILRRTYYNFSDDTYIGTADAPNNFLETGAWGDVYIKAGDSFGSGAAQQSGGNLYLKAGTPYSTGTSGGNVEIISRANANVGNTRPHVYIKHETTEIASFDDREVTFNETGADIDFRVESDGNTHALFVDAGSSEVGINNDTPDATLHVKTTGQNVGFFDSSDATATQFFIRNSNAVTGTYTLLGFAPANDISGAYIQVEAQEDFSVSANRTANMQFYTRDNGTFHNRLYLDDDSTVFNEVGRATDFRVESDSNTHMLFVDAGNNRVGINESSPDSGLHFSDPTSAYMFIEDTGGTAGGAMNTGVHFYAGGTFGGSVGYGTGGGYMAIANGVGPLAITTNNSAGSASRVNAILYNTANVFNEDGHDQDFRVESDNTNYMLFVDASSDRIGVYNSTPSVTLDVNGTIRSTTNNGGSGTYNTIAYQFSEGRGWGYNSIDDAVFYNAAGTTPFLARISEVLVNHDGSAYCDFRVKSYGNSHALFVEATRTGGGGSVNIGSSDYSNVTSVGHKFHIDGTQITQYIVTDTSAATNYPVGIYNANATYNGQRFKLQVNGGLANFSANNVNLSDARKKRDITPLDDGYLNKICAIPVKTFNYIDDPDDDEPNIGVIAQDVEAVAPELVNHEWDYDNEGNFIDTFGDGVPTKAVYSDDIMYAMMKALQELKAKNDALEARITALENA